MGTRNRGRTCKPLLAHEPESCASANSAIRAFRDAKVIKLLQTGYLNYFSNELKKGFTKRVQS
jgi:hypothetical protein